MTSQILSLDKAIKKKTKKTKMYYKAPLLCFDSKAVKAWRQLSGSSPGRAKT